MLDVRFNGAIRRIGDGDADDVCDGEAEGSGVPDPASGPGLGVLAGIVVEGVGGLLVPIGRKAFVLDLATALELPLIVAARPGLGTINHTLLTVGAAIAAGLRVAGIVMTPWPAEPDAMVRSNRATIERLAKIPVVGLPFVASAQPGPLAAAGASVPVKRWLGI